MMEKTAEYYADLLRTGIAAWQQDMAKGNLSLPTVSKKELLDAVQDGVRDAIWHTATYGTPDPDTHFFNAVTRGVRQAVASMKLKLPERAPKTKAKRKKGRRQP